MPIYEQVCGECGDVEAFCPPEKRHTCENCGLPCVTKPSLVNVHGIVFSNAEVSNQLGTRWETNAQKRDWFKRHPNVRPMTKGSPEEKAFATSLKDRQDSVMKRHGFKDAQHYKTEVKKAKASGHKNLESTNG